MTNRHVARAGALLASTVLLAGVPVLAQPGANASYGAMRAAPDVGRSNHRNAPAGEPLGDVRHARKLTSATLKDRSGRQVGEIAFVRTAPNGRPTSVRVALNTEHGLSREITLSAAELTYDPANNTVVTRRTEDELANMPSANGEKNYRTADANLRLGVVHSRQVSNPHKPDKAVSAKLGPSGF